MTEVGDIRAVLLMPHAFAAQLTELAQQASGGAVACVNTRDELEQIFAAGTPQLLLGFSTGVVVPRDLLARPGLQAWNVHGASPAYPGRDPHHFAAYEGATQFGATLHRMAPAVDQGEILRVSLETVPPEPQPHALLAIGVRHGLALAQGLLEDLARGIVPRPDPALRWTGPVRRRVDFLALCRITPEIGSDELDRRLRATSMPGYVNLVLDLHGRTFRLQPV